MPRREVEFVSAVSRPRVVIGHATNALRRMTRNSNEGSAHPFGIRETDRASDYFNGFRSGFYALQRNFYSEALNGLCRRLTCLGEDDATKLTRTKVCDCSELLRR